MKYITTTSLAFCAFWVTFFAFKAGYFLHINNFFVSFPRSHLLTLIFFFVTDVGSVISVILLSLALVLFLTIKGRYKEFIYVVFSLLGGLLAQTFLKNIFAVERPAQSLVGTVGYSFPSGHANMMTILCMSAYAYVFSKTESLCKRRVMLSLMILIPLMVGVSRIYLNAHWVSDVLAGWLFGIFWATLPLAYVSLRSHFTKS